MSGHKRSLRSRVVRDLVFLILASSIVTISAAGSDAAVFSFFGSLKEFLGLQPVPAKIAKAPDTAQSLPFAAFHVDPRRASYTWMFPPSCTPPPEGMVSWWPGDNDMSDIKSGHNGMLPEDVDYETGVVNKAFDFDGDDPGIQVPDDPAWDLGTNDFTIDAWVKTTPTGGSQAIVAHDDGGGYQNKWIFWFSGGQLQLHYNDTAWHQVYIGENFAPESGRWYHVAVVRGGSNYRFYVNGVELGDGNGKTDTSVVPDASYGLTIGMAEGAFVLNGSLDEVEIFNRALTKKNIEDIYNAGSAGKCRVFYTLNVTSDHGTVGRVPNLSQYLAGTAVQLTANPALGYSFSNWTGDIASSNNPVTVNMDAAKSVTANYLTSMSMSANTGTTPQSTMINTAFAHVLAVTVTDAVGGPIPGASVVFTAPATGASGVFVNGANTIAVLTDAFGVATAPLLANSTVGGPYEVTASTGSLTPVIFLLTNTGGPATHLRITGPDQVTAGVPFPLTVTALDAFDNIASGYGGIVHFTSTDTSPADLPANGTLVLGTQTYNPRLFRAGIQTISAYDLSNYSIAGISNNIYVIGAEARGFKVAAPYGAGIGRAFSFKVTAVDAFNNVATGYAGTVHFTGSDGTAVFSADSTLSNSTGTFSATFNLTGVQTITASDITAATAGTSNNINVFTSFWSRADFDGDGRTDISVFRPSEGIWYIDRSTEGFEAVSFGSGTDTLIPGDYDGDGKTDFAVFRPSAEAGVADFHVLNSKGFVYTGFEWGLPGDIPMTGDYDACGKIDIAVYRPSTSTWWIFKRQTQTFDSFQFGTWGDIPMVMDFNGDGKTDLAVYRPDEQMCFMSNASGTPSVNFEAIRWGLESDIYVPADYDGDGKDDVAVFRPSDGMWYILRSSDGGYTFRQFGSGEDIPVPGDYDGDGRDDIAVFRPSTGMWYFDCSTTGFGAKPFGTSTDKPIPATYNATYEW